MAAPAPRTASSYGPKPPAISRRRWSAFAGAQPSTVISRRP
ncbi:hypothetical protein NKH77_04930 [Streptomyces sp. M19]